MDLKTVDELLTTTRAVRKRLDFDRPVPPEVIEECIALAIQAPTGSNSQGWRWLVVTDDAHKKVIADAYRRGWATAYGGREAGGDESSQMERVLDSAQYLVDNLERVPLFVIPCILGRLPEGVPSGMGAGFWASIYPAVWSFQLALRSRGFGSALTTLHLFHELEVAEALGIPDTVTQAALLPVAYTKGTEFKPAKRRPATEVTFWDEWKHAR
jgi:nitroreductase